MIIIALCYFKYYCWFMKKILSLVLVLNVVWLTFLGIWNSVMAVGSEDVWINLMGDCLTWMWKWCLDYEKMIWIQEDQGNITAMSIVQDVIQAATYMVWTVLSIVIIYCGLRYILASGEGKEVNVYKKWLISAAIWALLVWWAYAIVRLIQYVAKW